MAIKRQMVEVFMSHAGIENTPLEEVAAALEVALDVAHQRHPSIRVEDADFARWLAERTTDAALPGHIEDLYLACACAGGDATALEQFERDILEQTRPVLRRLGCNDAEAADVLQDVRAKLLVGADAKIVQYLGTGPLLGWVRAVCGRQALAARRRRRPNETLDPDVLDLTDDPHLRGLKERYRDEFRTAFRAAVLALPDRDRALLAEVVVHETPVGDIATRHQVHRVTASRWLAKIRQTLLADTRRRLASSLALESADIDSVIRLIDSRLDISLYSVLVD